LREQLVTRTRVGSVLCAILMPFGIVLDFVAHPSLLDDFTWIRIGFGAGCGVLFALTYLRGIERFATALSVSLALWISAGIEVLVLATGPSDSPYYAGLNLIVLGMGLLYPWTMGQMALVCTAIFLIYIVPGVLYLRGQDLGALFNNCYFVLLTSVIAITSSHFGSKLRKREYFAQADLVQRTDELREASSQLQTSLEKLRELDRLKSQFFANVSHELRTPLTLILSPLEAILQDDAVELGAEMRDYLSSMHRNATRLLRLINNLLDLSKLEAGKVYLRYEPLELAPFLGSLLPPFQALAQRKRIRLTIEGNGLPAIHADAEKIDTVFQNLVANALKFTGEGGEVSVRLWEDDAFVHFAVSDTGIGIAEKDLPIIFNRFAQADGSATRRFGGTGIGLALVKELVEVHGGTVVATSTPGVGSTFDVSLPKGVEHIREDLRERRAVDLPVVRDRRESNRDPVSSLMPKSFHAPEGVLDWEEASRRDDDAEEPAGHERVLVVEDNVDMRRFLVRVLRAEVHVIEAVDGEDGLEKAREHLPDLVLSDVMMPGLSGYDLTRALKTDPKLRGIPVILLTAKRGVDAALEGFTHGADDYLGKPFNSRELLARIRAQLRLRDLARQLAQSQKMGMLGTLAAGLAHEIKNPVNFILNSLPVVRRALPQKGGDAASAANELLEVVEHGTRRIERIVDDLLTFSHVDESDLAPWSPNGGLRTTLQLLAHRAAGVEVTLAFDFDGEIEGRAGLLDQVLMNLVDNALRAAGPGGHVTVSTEREDDGVRIRVRDDGAGIAPEHLPRIFDPFFTTREVGQGTGLGLHLARQTIEAHGGTIEARSRLGEGAELTFWLPRRPPTGKTTDVAETRL
jgi:signal transduction histidine kinase